MFLLPLLYCWSRRSGTLPIEKDGAVRINFTKCDFCQNSVAAVIGNYAVCSVHVAHAMNEDIAKQAAEKEKSLKAAGISLADQHE